MRHILAAILALVLSACGGQVIAKPLVICLQPSDRTENIQGCDAMAKPTEEPDAARSVAIQAALPGPVVLWIGPKDRRAETVARYPAMLTEAAKYPGKFPHVYLYDEIGWCGTGLCWFDDEDLVLQGAAMAHAQGMKTIATILPDVILDPRFKLKDINAFDGITIDAYPSIRPTKPDLSKCGIFATELENLLWCSIQKLRAQGFKGDIGYIWQAFGLASDTHAQRMAYLTEQRKLINIAPAMGVTAVMPFGCYLGTGELQREPNLVPLCGTQYEYLVTP